MRITFIRAGTPGTVRLCFQYAFVPFQLVSIKVNIANVAVNDILPDKFDEPGKNGIRPIMLLNQMKKKRVNK